MAKLKIRVWRQNPARNAKDALVFSVFRERAVHLVFRLCCFILDVILGVCVTYPFPV